MKPKATDFAEWIAANPAPDLQELVRAHGCYLDIPEEAWREFFAAMKAWRAKRQDQFWR